MPLLILLLFFLLKQILLYRYFPRSARPLNLYNLILISLQLARDVGLLRRLGCSGQFEFLNLAFSIAWLDGG